MVWIYLGQFGCSSLDCGPNTIEENGQCVSVSSFSLDCGPGTIEENGLCTPGDDTTSPTDCGPGTILRNGECVDDDYQWLRLPFEVGFESYVSQGHHGNFSHNGNSFYAVDFGCPEGTPITAAHEGVVISTKSDSDTGCGDVSCSDMANYIGIDNGNGTIAWYYHLMLNGVSVVPGQVVGRGEVIGYSGNTGFSTGPHLHLVVKDLFYMSLPLAFDELMEDSLGVPVAGMTTVSENSQEVASESIDYSDCPTDAFITHGVILDSGLPCIVAERDQSYELSGYSTSDSVLIEQYSTLTDEWFWSCFATDMSGNFSGQLEWESHLFGGGGYLMILAADTECYSYQGWDSSPWVWLID